MAILVECPRCKARVSVRRDYCSCGMALKKASGKVYWIDFYVNGKRRRERIGTSKTAAQHRHREVLSARTEERYIDLNMAARLSLGDVCAWYLQLPEVRAKRSFRRDTEFIRHLVRLLGESTRISELTPGKVESYQRQRLSEPSPRHPDENIRPATVNKEVVCLKTILNRAVRHGKLDANPVSAVRKLPENNVRMRILSHDEFSRLVAACPDYLRPVVMTAYYTGMRKNEILALTWSELDLSSGFIRLRRERTKTLSARSVPLHPRLMEMFRALPRAIHTNRVFLLKGKPFDDCKRSFKSACEAAGIADFTFHDLRHCALNNLRLAGNDYFRIMAISGHKTMSVFKRYNLVTEDELSQVKWHDETGQAEAVDTYMDTKEKGAT